MSSSIAVTFISHAQPTDNLQPINRKDATLTNHGMNQTRALAEFFADTHFTVIYASDPKRTFTTAQALYKQQKDPKPIYLSSELLREQDPGIYPNLSGVDEKYPGGESLLDLAERSKRAITQVLLPRVWKAAKGGSDIHVAVVGHDLCLYEMAVIYELLQMSPNQAVEWKFDHRDKYDYLDNAAWTRVVIDTEESQSMDVEPMIMHVTNVNRHSHLDTIRGIKEFFGGARPSVANGASEKISRTMLKT